MGTAILMMKTQIGLGVLSIPLVFDTLGMVPGIIVLLAIAIITTWVCRKDSKQAHHIIISFSHTNAVSNKSDYIVGVFKINHPEVYGIDDVGKMIFGKPGQIIL